MVSSEPTELHYAIWPPDPLNWLSDKLASGQHFISITSVNSFANNVYVYLTNSQGTILTPLGANPANSAFNTGTFFNPPVTMLRWGRSLPAGSYTLNFLTEVCLPPTPTPTPIPACVSGGGICRAGLKSNCTSSEKNIGVMGCTGGSSCCQPITKVNL